MRAWGSKGILLAKALIVLKQQVAHLININSYPVTLKKDISHSRCCSVTSVGHAEKIHTTPEKRK